MSAILLTFLIPHYGAIGAALAVAATSGVVGVLLVALAVHDCIPPEELNA